MVLVEVSGLEISMEDSRIPNSEVVFKIPLCQIGYSGDVRRSPGLQGPTRWKKIDESRIIRTKCILQVLKFNMNHPSTPFHTDEVKHFCHLREGT